MCNKFETLHANYLDPPEPKVWGYDWKGEEIYVGDIDEYLKEAYLTTSLKIAGE